jgi:hypothetical protein
MEEPPKYSPCRRRLASHVTSSRKDGWCSRPQRYETGPERTPTRRAAGAAEGLFLLRAAPHQGAGSIREAHRLEPPPSSPSPSAAIVRVRSSPVRSGRVCPNRLTGWRNSASYAGEPVHLWLLLRVAVGVGGEFRPILPPSLWNVPSSPHPRADEPVPSRGGGRSVEKISGIISRSSSSFLKTPQGLNLTE